MKRYSMSWAAAREHKPEHPDRTARRNAGRDGSLDFDIVFQVWPNRAAMLKTIQMQESGPDFRKAWKACA